MIALSIILGILLAVSLAWNVIITRRAMLLDSMLQDGGESIEECLDEINEAYGTVGKILRSPLASNDPKIVQIHKELKRVHDSLLVIANGLVSSWNTEEQEEDSTREQE